MVLKDEHAPFVLLLLLPQMSMSSEVESASQSAKWITLAASGIDGGH